MYHRIVYLTLLVLLILHNVVEGRNQRKTKKTTDTENPAPQPNVLTYSTFGFNDVASYDGFVPTSPDYTNYLNKYKETSEKLYAPAFPSAPDSDFTSNSQALIGEPFTSVDAGQQSSMLQYNPLNIYSPSDNINKNSASDVEYQQSTDNNNNPVYGTKINFNNKTSSSNSYNNTEVINSETYQSDPNYSNFYEPQTFMKNKQLYSESINSKQNMYNYATTYPTPEIEDSMKAAPVDMKGSLKFAKALDFADNKPYDTMETESRYSPVASKPSDIFNSMVNSVSDDTLKFYEDQSNKLTKMAAGFKNALDSKDNEDALSSKQIKSSYQDLINKYSEAKNNKIKKVNYDYKDVVKVKPWIPEGSNSDKKRLKNFMKGYEYATNYSSTSFKYDEPKKQYNSNTDEIIPSSSNNIDYSNYQYPQMDYTNFKGKPSSKKNYNTYNNDDLSQNIGNKFNPSVEYLNKFKNLYNNPPTSSTNWGNIFKATDYSSFKTHNSKPAYNDDENYDTVQIPKRPNSYRFERDFEKDSDSVPKEWSPYNKKTSSNRHKNEWNKENINNRFKSEEDLLGLRNHDTSHPSYLPTFKYTGNEDPEESFKAAVEKWREDYIKSKYRDASYDYEASEAKQVHAVNPYQIEVPHPVIVPVPQPYPVRVPIAKPVAVPMMQEITVPIEKPVPYPVYKKVPYPVEKLVPVPVVKQVPMPVVKPYPVPIPQVKPVFHHSRPYREGYDLTHDNDDGDDYFPRPESSNIVYNKKPKSSRNRSRRPSRTSHQERSKAGRQQRRPNTSRERDSRRYMKPPSDRQRFRYHDSDFDEDREHGRLCTESTRAWSATRLQCGLADFSILFSLLV